MDDSDQKSMSSKPKQITIIPSPSPLNINPDGSGPSHSRSNSPMLSYQKKINNKSGSLTRHSSNTKSGFGYQSSPLAYSFKKASLRVHKRPESPHNTTSGGTNASNGVKEKELQISTSVENIENIKNEKRNNDNDKNDNNDNNDRKDEKEKENSDNNNGKTGLASNYNYNYNPCPATPDNYPPRPGYPSQHDYNYLPQLALQDDNHSGNNSNNPSPNVNSKDKEKNVFVRNRRSIIQQRPINPYNISHGSPHSPSSVTSIPTKTLHPKTETHLAGSSGLSRLVAASRSTGNLISGDNNNNNNNNNSSNNFNGNRQSNGKMIPNISNSNLSSHSHTATGTTATTGTGRQILHSILNKLSPRLHSAESSFVQQRYPRQNGNNNNNNNNNNYNSNYNRRNEKDKYTQFIFSFTNSPRFGSGTNYTNLSSRFNFGNGDDNDDSSDDSQLDDIIATEIDVSHMLGSVRNNNIVGTENKNVIRERYSPQSNVNVNGRHGHIQRRSTANDNNDDIENKNCWNQCYFILKSWQVCKKNSKNSDQSLLRNGNNGEKHQHNNKNKNKNKNKSDGSINKHLFAHTPGTTFDLGKKLFGGSKKIFKIVLFLSFLFGIHWFNYGLFNTIVNNEQEDTFKHFSNWQIELILSASLVGLVLSAPICGYIARQYMSIIKLLFYGYLIMTTSTLCSAIVTNFYILFFIRILMGIGDAMVLCVAPPLILYIAPTFEKSTYISFFLLSMVSGYSIGSFVSNYILIPHIKGVGVLSKFWRIFFVCESIVMVPIIIYIFMLKIKINFSHFELELINSPNSNANSNANKARYNGSSSNLTAIAGGDIENLNENTIINTTVLDSTATGIINSGLLQNDTQLQQAQAMQMEMQLQQQQQVHSMDTIVKLTFLFLSKISHHQALHSICDILTNFIYIILIISHVFQCLPINIIVYLMYCQIIKSNFFSFLHDYVFSHDKSADNSETAIGVWSFFIFIEATFGIIIGGYWVDYILKKKLYFIQPDKNNKKHSKCIKLLFCQCNLTRRQRKIRRYWHRNCRNCRNCRKCLRSCNKNCKRRCKCKCCRKKKNKTKDKRQDARQGISRIGNEVEREEIGIKHASNQLFGSQSAGQLYSDYRSLPKNIIDHAPRSNILLSTSYSKTNDNNMMNNGINEIICANVDDNDNDNNNGNGMTNDRNNIESNARRTNSNSMQTSDTLPTNTTGTATTIATTQNDRRGTLKQLKMEQKQISNKKLKVNRHKHKKHKDSKDKEKNKKKKDKKKIEKKKKRKKKKNRSKATETIPYQMTTNLHVIRTILRFIIVPLTFVTFLFVLILFWLEFNDNNLNEDFLNYSFIVCIFLIGLLFFIQLSGLYICLLVSIGISWQSVAFSIAGMFFHLTGDGVTPVILSMLWLNHDDIDGTVQSCRRNYIHTDVILLTCASILCLIFFLIVWKYVDYQVWLIRYNSVKIGDIRMFDLLFDVENNVNHFGWEPSQTSRLTTTMTLTQTQTQTRTKVTSSSTPNSGPMMGSNSLILYQSDDIEHTNTVNGSNISIDVNGTNNNSNSRIDNTTNSSGSGSDDMDGQSQLSEESDSEVSASHDVSTSEWNPHTTPFM